MQICIKIYKRQILTEDLKITRLVGDSSQKSDDEWMKLVINKSENRFSDEALKLYKLLVLPFGYNFIFFYSFFKSGALIPCITYSFISTFSFKII